ncbi:hypothetical protein SERLA73DRAFT_156158 [Serpula lacrymans var. lacrymans S7.3]|uniref:Uncharacterized protein n=1 Tax=Serpula lacrymans var. lacrymans (strain S7.3) TaxID=936435 RepID=F8QD90_SERL3|nr:hypothetical protein SERLA73DRAFT_156158 [Serpula lacrymans var. lacrymans S7.3]
MAHVHYDAVKWDMRTDEMEAGKFSLSYHTKLFPEDAEGAIVDRREQKMDEWLIHYQRRGVARQLDEEVISSTGPEKKQAQKLTGVISYFREILLTRDPERLTLNCWRNISRHCQIYKSARQTQVHKVSASPYCSGFDKPMYRPYGK